MTAPIASGWSKIAGWDSHPLENASFTRRTPKGDLRGFVGLATALFKPNPAETAANYRDRSIYNPLNVKEATVFLWAEQPDFRLRMV